MPSIVRHPAIPVYALIFVLVAGTCLVIPNEVDLRVQRMVNMLFIAELLLGFYTLVFLSISSGLLMLYVCFETVRGINITTLTFILCMMGFFIAIVQSRIYWQPYRGLIYDALLFIAALNLLFLVMQFCGFYFLLHPLPGVPSNQVVGLMTNPDETFALFMLCAPAFLRRHRWQILVVLPVGMFLSKFWEWWDKSYVLWHHIGPLRFEVWADSIRETMEQHAWWGAGFGQFGSLHIVKMGEYFLQAHNEFVEGFWIGGIVGILIGLAFLCDFLWAGWRNRDKRPLLGFIMACISAMAFFSWHIAPLAIITVLFLGMIQADRMEERIRT